MKMILTFCEYFKTVGLFSTEDLSTQLKFDNFDFSSHTITFGVALLCLFLGVIAAIIINVFRNYTSGKAVRLLLKNGATSAENAKTPKELGFHKNFFIRYSLRTDSYLRKIVSVYENEPKLNKLGIISEKDFENLLLYIPEKSVFKAEAQYKRKGNDLLAGMFAAIIAIIVFFVILYQLPNLLEFIDSCIG